MIDENELPSSPAERVALLESIVTERATGNMAASTTVYEHLRREFMNDPATRELLPAFVRTSRTLHAFWPLIKGQAGTYAERRRFISEGFTPLVDYFEGRSRRQRTP